ncbi:MAG: DUF1015 family protein [Daejeonella sp.]
MPQIKPFKGIRPNTALVKQVVLDLENLSLDDARQIRKENPYSYVNMLVPKVENHFLRGSRQELAYKKINENFEEFLDKGVLIRDEKPALYIYRITHRGITQTGIWTITAIDDYLNNTIKKHELTRADREKALIDYLQQTGIDANPVLITYSRVNEIEQIIAKNSIKTPDLNFNTENAEHQLWKIDREEDVNKLISCFADLPGSYIADGHHRAAAASLLGIERRKLNLKHTGDEEYNFFTSVYMATDQLHIFEFNRLLKDLNGHSAQQFLEKIGQNFGISIIEGNTPIKPEKLHEFALYLNKTWYKLTAKPQTYRQDNPVSHLDVTILQEYIFSPIINITDPRTDVRLSFVGGITALEELVKQVDEGFFVAAFILYPTSIEQLIAVADAGEVMPPKSTWFEPKFQAGLVIHQID